MINNYQELLNKIDTLDYGSTILKISLGGNSVQLNAQDNPSKDILRNSDYWLDKNISYHMRRNWDSENKKWVIKPSSLHKIRESILTDLLVVLSRCSTASMPERTSLYKEYRYYNSRYNDDPRYLSDAIAILNYYFASKTDSICKSNVIGLLQLLRKKYNGKSS